MKLLQSKKALRIETIDQIEYPACFGSISVFLVVASTQTTLGITLTLYTVHYEGLFGSKEEWIYVIGIGKLSVVALFIHLVQRNET